MNITEKLYFSLERIVSYYDALQRTGRIPTMDDQAKATHENTMFGEARKVLEECKKISVTTETGIEVRYVSENQG